jgi:hypothetical protein
MNQRQNEKLHPDGQYTCILIIYQWVELFRMISLRLDSVISGLNKRIYLTRIPFLSPAAKQRSDIVIRGGFRGGVRGVRPPKIRKAYVIQR